MLLNTQHVISLTMTNDMDRRDTWIISASIYVHIA